MPSPRMSRRRRARCSPSPSSSETTVRTNRRGRTNAKNSTPGTGRRTAATETTRLGRSGDLCTVPSGGCGGQGRRGQRAARGGVIGSGGPAVRGLEEWRAVERELARDDLDSERDVLEAPAADLPDEYQSAVGPRDDAVASAVKQSGRGAEQTP